MLNFIKIEFECLCNLNCNYCFCKGEKYETPIEDVCSKIDEVFNIYNPKNTYYRIEGIGEVTLYPQLVNFLNRKSQENYSIQVLSNGVLTEVIKKNINLKWIISIDGHTVEMNKYRNLSYRQICEILDLIINYNLEIQCVYCDQTIEEINEFIHYLESRNYRGFLHIFPIKHLDRRLDRYLDYDKLIKTNLIPNEDYFRRWKYIFKNKKRDFICDFFKYGFVYRIMHDEREMRMIKCDCGNFVFEYEKVAKYNEKNCNTCINHYEYEIRRMFSYELVNK